MIGAIMKRSHLKTMTTDELWTLHQEIAMTLAQKILAEIGCGNSKNPTISSRLAKSARADRTPLYFPNIEILKIHPKPGPGAASSHAG